MTPRRPDPRVPNVSELQAEGAEDAPTTVAAIPAGLPTGMSLPRQVAALAIWPFLEQVLGFLVGFVDTAMTYGLPGMFLVASPQYVGERIVRALDSSADVVYLPWFWRYIMLIIRHIPEPIFKRLKL